MNDDQLPKYRVNWSKAWKVLRASGVPAADQEKTRKRWHTLIGAVYLRGKEAGLPKSSKHLTNAEFDRFLKRCAATHSADSLKAQFDLDDQPLIRLQHATDPLLDLIKMPMESRENYLAGIYSNVQRKRIRETNTREIPLAEMPDADLQLVVIALTHTVEHKLGVDHNHPRTGKGPRSRFDHQVGSKTATAQTVHGDRVHVDEPADATFDPSAPFG